MKRFTVILLIIVLSFAGTALAQDDAEPTAEPAAQPELPTDPPEDIEVGALVQRFDFTDAQGWPTGAEGAYNWMKEAAIIDGRYTLTSADITGIMYSGVFDLGDFYAQVEVHPEACPSEGQFGLVFRLSVEPVSDYYFYYVQCDGFFNAGTVANYNPTFENQGALEQPIVPGEPHMMGVLAQGSEISLYWDGARVGSFDAALRLRGEFGLSMSPAADGSAVKIGFDNLAVWALPSDGDQQPVEAPAPTEEPTEEPAEAPAEVAAPTEEPTDAEAGETAISIPPRRPPDLAFDSETAWTEGATGFVREDALVSAQVVDGSYVLSPLTGNAALFSGTADLTDFYAQYNFYPETCPPNAILGFAFRQETAGTYYVLGFRCDGTWLVQAMPPSAAPITSDQVAEPFSPESGTYSLGILAQGDQFTIYLQGEEIGSFTDATIPHGDIGFHVQNGAGEEVLRVVVEQLRVWNVTEADRVPVAADAAAGGGEAQPPTGGDEEAQPAAVTDQPSAPPVEVGTLRYEATFEGNDQYWWPVGTYDFAETDIQDGRYIVTSTDIVSTIRSTVVSATNFYAQFEVSAMQCPGAAAFGLPFRIGGETFGDFYAAIMQCDGKWRLSAVYADAEGNTQGDVLADGELGAPLALGEVYTLGVYANGQEIAFYWDGEELARTTQNYHGTGDVGIQIRPAFPSYEKPTIAIDNFRVWNLPQP